LEFDVEVGMTAW